MVYSDLRSHRFTLKLIFYIIAQIGTRKKALPRNARAESLLMIEMRKPRTEPPVTSRQSPVTSRQSPVTDSGTPAVLDLVIQLDKTLFHGEVIRGGGLDRVKEDTAIGVGDGDEDMLTPDEAVRRQGAEIFRERAAMCRKAIGDGVRIHEALIARTVFFLNGEISESTHCCSVTVGVTGMKLVVVPAEDDRLAGAAI